MKKYLFLLIGAAFICVSGCFAGQGRHRKQSVVEEGHKESMERPQLIVFDFGKVLGGSSFDKIVDGVQRELQIPVEEADDIVSGYITRTGSKSEFWKEIAKNKDLPSDWRERFKNIKLESIDVNRDVLKIAEELRSLGYRLAVLSNTTPTRAEKIRSIGAYDLFDPVILSFEIGVSKPSKEAYQALLKAANVPPEECLFIDDNLSNIKAAANMGFDVILFTSAEKLRNELEKRSILYPRVDSPES